MKTCFLLAGLLAASLAGHAQQAAVATGSTPTVGATPYQVQYDSLLARAGRVRASAAARTQRIKASFTALLGTRRAITSFGSPRALANSTGDAFLRDVRLKKETVKHKQRGAIIRKVVYYSSRRLPRLYEYYEDGQLVRLELNDYSLSTGSGNTTFVSMRWLRGNYLTVIQRGNTSAGGRTEQTQTFVDPAPLAQ